MTHRFPIKEIARQAGLGTATVDRVLNNRAYVSPQTRNRVATALRELKAQEAQLIAKGRRVIFDVVAEAPQRFSREIRIAAEAAARAMSGVAIRLRFQFHEIMTEAETLDILASIARRGSNGICLKARDTQAVRGMIVQLAQARIPVFTLVTDLPGSARQGYFGLDNAEAGRTAAYLLAQGLPDYGATILTSRSQDSFRGETDRFTAFRDLITALKPGVRLTEVSGGAGVTVRTVARLNDVLTRGADVWGVYSMGGGNAAILQALAAHGQRPTTFVAHDLDRENARLLTQGDISFVLHHDLAKDMETLFGAGLGQTTHTSDNPTGSSDVQIITPYNLPRVVGLLES
jgi:LacI family transcriptional regulator